MFLDVKLLAPGLRICILELRVKSARLAELDVALNIDHGPSQEEQISAKSTRPSVLEGLKRPLPPRQKPDKPKSRSQER